MRLMPSPYKADYAQGQDRQRGELITGHCAGHSRRVAKKFMRKTKRAVTNQIQMKMLARQPVLTAQEKKESDGNHIEKYFHRYRGPARGAGAVPQSKPGRCALPAQAAAVQ